MITLALESREGGVSRARRGKLHLVDLAGSESLVGEKEALHISHETRAINSALTALCDVMQTLSKNARRAQGSAPQMVPYRNHKLTRLLADSLGGNSTTLMVAAVQTVAEHARQTLGTLKFAARARDITTKARANGDGGANDAQLEALRARVAELQGRLASRELEIDKLEGLNAEREARRSLALREQIDGLEQAMRDERAQLRRSLDEQRAAQQRRATEGTYAAAMASAEMHRHEAAARAARLRLHMMQDALDEAEAKASAADEAARATAGRLEAAEAQLVEALGRAAIGGGQHHTTGDTSRARAGSCI